MGRNTAERAVETEMDKQNRIKRSGLTRLVYIQGYKPSPPREGEPTETKERKKEEKDIE